MRIVQTPVRFYPAIGGVERYVLELSAQLVRRGHRATVICAGEPKTGTGVVHGILVKRLSYVGKVSNTNITPFLLLRLLGEKFDLIHTHMPTPWSAEISIIAAKIKRKPCILTYHNDVEKAGLLGLLTRIYNNTLLRLVLASVDKILITQPGYLAESRVLGRWRHKIVVVPVGVASAPKQPATRREPTTVLFVGVLDRFHRYKGLEHLIRAALQLKGRWPGLQMQIVGTGELCAEYSALTHRLGLERQVQFLGRVDDRTLEHLYRRATVFVLPSVDKHEGFGIVLVEAMAQGAPVVTTTRVGLSEEIARYGTGCVVPPRDPAALARAIDTIFGNAQLALEMGRGGNRLVREKFLWSEICQRVETVYSEAINQRGKAT